MLAIGGLLLLMAVAHPLVKRLPITTAMVYLLVGVALGPLWLNVVRVDPVRHAAWLHRAAEISVIISLFTVGMKLRLPVLDRRLRPAICLAFVSMVLTVGFITLAGTWLLGLPLGAAVLLGAILAPTDPVLASDVQTTDPHDQDKLRLTLTAEAGFNDGTAFPFVMLGLGLLGLHELGDYASRWWLVDVAWAITGGLAIGGAIGAATGWLVIRLHTRRKAVVTLGQYVLLGVIGISYGAAVLVHAYGFLAVFAAGVGLRAMERIATGPRQRVHDTLTAAAAGTVSEIALRDPTIAPAYIAGALLSTNEQLERILEVALVVIVGAALFAGGFSWAALWFAPLLFFVMRPLAALPVLGTAKFSALEFSLVGWFGIRGIGSIYYLMYALEEGIPSELAAQLVSLTLSTVALSIVVHGVSVTPLLSRYRRR
jgi:NhaP-type Na+/H+ or K+/H+ antiporter